MRGKLTPLALGLCLVLLFLYGELTPNPMLRTLVTRLQHIAYDMRLRSLTLESTSTGKQSAIAIVDIDEKSLQQEGHWPWPRNKMAQLTQKLREQGATVIAFDTLFSEASHNLLDTLSKKLTKDTPQHKAIAAYLQQQAKAHAYDQQFAKQLALSETLLGFVLHNTAQPSKGKLRPPLLINNSSTPFIPQMPHYISNITILQEASHGGGFTSILPDTDGIIRRVPLLLRHEKGIYPALALEAVRRYLLIDKVTLNTEIIGDHTILHSIQMGGTTIPTDANGRMIITFQGAMHSFPYYSATDLLHDELPPFSLQGKLVFIGTSAFGLGDMHSTPLQNTNYPGVEIQANIAHTLLAQNFLYTPGWSRGAEMAVLLITGITAALLLPCLSPLGMLLIIVLSMASLIIAHTLLWVLAGWVLPEAILSITLLFSLLLFNILYAFLFEERERKRLKTLFGRYVPKRHIDTMMRSDHHFSLEGETKNMSVLFADVQNFTSCCQYLSAAQIKNMLNTVLTPLTKIIFDQSGTIDKYIGDMVMAFWGAPLPDPRHPEHAVLSALQMIQALRHMEAQWVHWKIPPLRMGIGINTGPMHIGDMGSEYRLAYTVLGDAVNLAARLESLTRHYHVPIIVSEYTQQATPTILYRRLDRVTVKGKESPVTLYEPLDSITHADDRLQKKCEQHAQALSSYFQQAWSQAYTEFNQLIQTFPEDSALYHVYLKRITKFKKTPPPAGWDGVYHLTHK